MTRKIFGPKSITHLIYGILMMLPFLAIGVRCAYVTLNKNAKDSYTGSLKQSITTYVNQSSSNMPTGSLVTYYFVNENTSRDTGHSGWFFYENLSFNPNLNYYADRFRLSYSNQKLQFSNGSQYSYVDYLDFTFNLVSFSDTDTGVTYVTNMFYISYFFNQDLDNVFDYSVNQLIDENNGFVPKNDFVGLLNGVFSENSNHLYLKLTNWYLNYALLISTIYILFLAMLWFVNLCRNILEKSMNIGNGVD